MQPFKLIPKLLIVIAVLMVNACSTTPADNARSSGNSGDPDPAVRSTAGGGY